MKTPLLAAAAVLALAALPAKAQTVELVADMLPPEPGLGLPPYAPPPRYSAPAPRYEYEERYEPPRVYGPRYGETYGPGAEPYGYGYAYRRDGYGAYPRYEDSRDDPPRPPADIAEAPYAPGYDPGPRYALPAPPVAEPRPVPYGAAQCDWPRREPYWDGYRWVRPRPRACE